MITQLRVPNITAKMSWKCDVFATLLIQSILVIAHENSNENTFDFIIVGGGVAGCVLANRLSENHNVLVLEAGGKHPGDILDTPATYMDVVMETDLVKLYPSLSQQNAGLMANGILNHIVGIVPGGGSTINGMIYNRGSNYDYDNWANVTGDQTWSYENLLKFFKRVEDYTGAFPSDQHGTGGPIPVSSSNYAPGLSTFMQAGEFLGYETDLDPNGPQKIGFAKLEFTRRNGRRVDAFRGYVEPLLLSRPTLKFLTSSTVSHIIFKGTTAIGVSYVNSESKTIAAFARKEVILSAGSINSPAILMRSGVGPADVLEENRILPIKRLPVGHNLIDHLGVALNVILPKNSTDVLIPEKDLTPGNYQVFKDTGDGPFSSCSGAHGQAFLVSSVRKQLGQNNWPDLQIVFFNSPAALKIFPDTSDLDDDKNATEGISVTLMPILGRPQSSGRVVLNPKDVNGIPLIDFRYFENKSDIVALTEAIKFAIKLVDETPPFQAIGARVSNKPFGHCKHLPFRSDEYFECLIRYTTISGLHISGTCRMGKVDDPTAVVDSNLKIIGIQGLRVVDASIMPNITNCNTQAPVYVIAEKAADQILLEWQQKQLCKSNVNDIPVSDAF